MAITVRTETRDALRVAALVEVLRPRRSKSLPRHFVMVATASEVVVFKASGGSGEKNEPYEVRVREGEQGRWPRSAVSIADLEEGASSKGGTLVLAGESIPVARPNLSGDPNTDELLRLLSGG
jgi:hypothetical protein